MTVEQTRIGAVRDAIAELGRKRFTAQDLEAPSGIDAKEISVMLAAEVKKGRLERLETGVYRALRGAYEPTEAVETNGRREGVVSLAPTSSGLDIEFRFVIETAEGHLLTDQDGELWVARRVKLDVV